MIEVREIDKKSAKEFIEKYHYTKRCPVFVFAIALYYNGELTQVAIFSHLVGRFQAKEIWDKGDNTNTLELSRMAGIEVKPVNTSSILLSRAFKHIKNTYPQYKIIVSLADNSMNHYGYVYQAANFKYYGKSRKTKWFFLDGNRIHERSLYDNFGTCAIDKIKEKVGDRFTVKEAENNRKDKYYYIVAQSKKEKRQIEKLIKVKNLPYPKSERQRYYDEKDIQQFNNE